MFIQDDHTNEEKKPKKVYFEAPQEGGEQNIKVEHGPEGITLTKTVKETQKGLVEIKEQVEGNIPPEVQACLKVLEEMEPPPNDADLFVFSSRYSPEAKKLINGEISVSDQFKYQRRAAEIYREKYSKEITNRTLAESRKLFEDLKKKTPTMADLNRFCEDDINWGKSKINRLAAGMYIASKIEKNDTEPDLKSLLKNDAKTLNELGFASISESNQAIQMYLSYKLESQNIGRIIEFTANTDKNRAEFVFSKPKIENGVLTLINTRYIVRIEDDGKISFGIDETHPVFVNSLKELVDKIGTANSVLGAFSSSLDLPENYDTEETEEEN